MNLRRTWAEPVESVDAERLFSRFVRSVLRRQKTSTVRRGAEATTMVSAPTRPQRRVNDATAAIYRSANDPDIAEIRKRRLLGQYELDATLAEDERRKLVVEMAALYKHGHVDDVTSELERVKSRYPMDIELSGMLGDFFLGRGDLARAVEMLFSMVDAYFERADPDAARRCLERIKALDPENQRLQRFQKVMRHSHA